MDLQLAQEKDVVLGPDFLTWLWYRSEKQNHVFKTEKGEEFSLHLGQKIVVQGGEGESLEKAVCSGMLSRLQEAKLGLRNGKKVTQARVQLEQDSNAWSVQIEAAGFTWSGFKTPRVDVRAQEGDDPDGIFLEKLYLVERAVHFIDAVYAQFLTLRLSPEWPEEVKSFKQWLYED